MTNDELMAAWRRKLPFVEPTGRELSAFALGVEVGEALRAARAAPTPLVAGWIKCSDRLPAEWEDVLVWPDGPDLPAAVGHWARGVDGVTWWTSDGGALWAEAWMPLPAPPTREGA